MDTTDLGIFTGMEECAKKGVLEQGFMDRVESTISILLILRAPELFAYDKGPVHEVYCLRREDITF